LAPWRAQCWVLALDFDWFTLMQLRNNAAEELASVCPTRSVGSVSRNHKFFILLIIALWAVLYIPGIFSPPLLDDADTVHAEAAREMVVSHDWVTLHVNGIRYLEKAPLMYWGIAVSYKLFGVSDWSTRLPLLLGILFWLLAVYELGRYAYGERAGMYASVVMATALSPYLFTRFMIPDALVGLWLTLSVYFFLRSLQEKSPTRFTCWGFAVTCALNVLTKGLIGIVFPLATISVYLVLTGNLRHLLRLRLFSSTMVFLAFAAPWHILAALSNPDQGATRGFLWFYFVNEHFLRYLNKRIPPGYDTVPLLIFWGVLIFGLAPWSIFLPQAVREVPWRWRQLRNALDGQQRANLLFALWVVVIMVFFSFSTRQEYYTIPALPGMALLVGNWLAKESALPADSQDRRAGKIISAGFFAIALVASLLGAALLMVSHPPPPGTDLAELLKKNPTEYDLSLGHVLDLTPQALGAFRIPLLGAVLSLSIGAGLNWLFRLRRRSWAGNAALVLMMIALLACVHSAFVTFSPILSSHELAVAIERHYRPGDIIVVGGEYSKASSLNFYTRVPVRVWYEPIGALWYGSKFPDAPHVFETDSSFSALWSGPETVFLWTNDDRPKELRGAQSYLLARSGGKSILTNRALGN
jgi:4-amino-4-deoxy-L-arabinose transferase-like glycosyltransferase